MKKDVKAIAAVLLFGAVPLSACTNMPVSYPTLHVAAQRNAIQTDLNLSGSGYTPGASVSFFINNLPLPNGTCATSTGQGFTTAKADGSITGYISVGYWSSPKSEICLPIVVARDNKANLAGATGISGSYWWP